MKSSSPPPPSTDAPTTTESVASPGPANTSESDVMTTVDRGSTPPISVDSVAPPPAPNPDPTPAPTPAPGPANEQPPTPERPAAHPTRSPFEAESDDEDAVALFVRFPYALVAGHSSVLQVKVENRSDRTIRHGEMLIEGRSLESLCRQVFRRISPHQTKSFDIEIEPKRAGPSILQMELVVEDETGKRSYRGTASEPVHAAPESGNINISIGDIQGNKSGGANAGLGAEYGNVEISNLLGENKPITLNDLLTSEREVEFEEVDLDLDYGLSARAVFVEKRSRARGLRLPPDFVGHVQPANRLVLDPAEDGTPGPLTVVTGPEFTLGRNRTKANLATWWWPRSEEFDEKTKRISQIHACLRAESGQLFVWDNDSANGTLCDGQELPRGGRETATPFTHRTSLALAHDYEMDIEIIPGAHESGPAINGIERWMGPPAGAPPAISGSVNFSPSTCERPPFSTLWLFTDAAFGSSGANPLHTPDPALAEVQGRLHYFRSCFWLESIADNHAMNLYGRTLLPGEIVPLTNGMRLQVGNLAYRIKLEKVDS